MMKHKKARDVMVTVLVTVLITAFMFSLITLFSTVQTHASTGVVPLARQGQQRIYTVRESVSDNDEVTLTVVTGTPTREVWVQHSGNRYARGRVTTRGSTQLTWAVSFTPAAVTQQSVTVSANAAYAVRGAVNLPITILREPTHRRTNDPTTFTIRPNGTWNVSWGTVETEPFARDFHSLRAVEGDYPHPTSGIMLRGTFAVVTNAQGAAMNYRAFDYDVGSIISDDDPVAPYFYKEILLENLTGTPGLGFRQFADGTIVGDTMRRDGEYANIRVDIGLGTELGKDGEIRVNAWNRIVNDPEIETAFSFDISATPVQFGIGLTTWPNAMRAQNGLDFGAAYVKSPGAIIRLERVQLSSYNTEFFGGGNQFAYTEQQTLNNVTSAETVGYFMLSDEGQITIYNLPRGFYRTTLVRPPLGFSNRMYNLASTEIALGFRPVITDTNGNLSMLSSIGMVGAALTGAGGIVPEAYVYIALMPADEWCTTQANIMAGEVWKFD